MPNFAAISWMRRSAVRQVSIIACRSPRRSGSTRMFANIRSATPRISFPPS